MSASTANKYTGNGKLSGPALMQRAAAISSSARCEVLSLSRSIGLLAILCLLLSLSACTGQKGDAQSDKLTVDLTGYNHTDYGFGFAVVMGKNEMLGPPLGPHNGGGWICCLTVPRQYKPGMKVTVQWPANGDNLPDHKREVEIPPYDGSKGAGFLAVHIFQDQHVEVYVTSLGLGHPDYPVKTPL